MKQSVAALVCAVLCSVAACSRSEPAEPPVATPSVSLSKDKAAIGSPLQITYKFEVADGATFEADHAVFVHVIEPDGERLWQDDHMPPVPTSQWKPGQTIEYRRMVFVPNYPYIGDAEIRLGLHNPATGRRLTLEGQEVGRRDYVVARLNLLPQSENIYLMYMDGWHPPEVNPADPAVEWQWTKAVATISFKNPKRDATFYLEYDARVDQFPQPQQVAIRVGEQTIATLTADSRERRLVTFPITAAQFGEGDMASITLQVDPTFAPGGSDTRELGIRVYNAFVEPQ